MKLVQAKFRDVEDYWLAEFVPGVRLGKGFRDERFEI